MQQSQESVKFKIKEILQLKYYDPMTAQQIFIEMSKNYQTFFFQALISIAYDIRSTQQGHISGLDNTFFENQFQQKHIRYIMQVFNKQALLILRTYRLNQNIQIQDKKDFINKLWRPLKVLLTSNIHSYRQIDILKPSLSALIELCDISMIIQNFKNDFCQKHQNQNGMLLLSKCLLASHIKPQFLIQLSITLFYEIQSRFQSDLSKLIQKLNFIQDQIQAVAIVKKKLDTWNQYMLLIQLICKKTFQLHTSQQNQILYKIFNSQNCQKMLRSFFELQKIIGIDQIQNSGMIVRSRFSQLNFKMNKLKQCLFKVINNEFLSKLQSLGQDNQFVQNFIIRLIRQRQIVAILRDISEFSRIQYESYEENKIKQLSLLKQEYILLVNILKNKNLKEILLTEINCYFGHNINEFIFLTFISNVNKVQLDRIENEEQNLNYENGKQLKIKQAYKKSFKQCQAVSQFMLKLCQQFPQIHQFLLDFSLKIINQLTNTHQILTTTHQMQTVNILTRFNINLQYSKIMTKHSLNMYLYLVQKLTRTIPSQNNFQQNLQLTFANIRFKQVNDSQFKNILKIVLNCFQIWSKQFMSWLIQKSCKKIRFDNKFKQDQPMFYLQFIIEGIKKLYRINKIQETYKVMNVLFQHLSLILVRSQRSQCYQILKNILLDQKKHKSTKYSFHLYICIYESCSKRINRFYSNLHQNQINNQDDHIIIQSNVELFTIVLKMLVKQANQKDVIDPLYISQKLEYIVSIAIHNLRYMSELQCQAFCQLMEFIMQIKVNKISQKYLIQQNPQIINNIYKYLISMAYIDIPFYYKCLRKIGMFYKGNLLPFFYQLLYQKIQIFINDYDQLVVSKKACLFQILKILNLQFFYNFYPSQKVQLWKSMCKMITQIQLKQNQSSTQEKYKLLNNTYRKQVGNYQTKCEIQFLKLKVLNTAFQENINCFIEYHESVQTNFLIKQCENLDQYVTFEDLAIIIFAFEKIDINFDDRSCSEAILLLCKKLVSANLKQKTIQTYLLQFFDPFQAAKAILNKYLLSNSDNGYYVGQILKNYKEFIIFEGQRRRIKRLSVLNEEVGCQQDNLSNQSLSNQDLVI